MNEMMLVSVENLNGQDTTDLQLLAKSVGWTFTAGQAGLYLSSGRMVFGYRHQGRLIASAGIYIYGSQLASLGIVIVHSKFQRLGLGKRIVKQCLTEAERTNVPVALVATEQGSPLYKSLGFQTIGHIHRFEADDVRHDQIHTQMKGVSNLGKGDLTQVIRLDETVFGAHRQEVYEGLFRNIHTGAVLRDENGTVRGFALSVHRGDLLVIGPVIAEKEEAAINLVRSVCVGWKGRVRIDVPNEQTSFMMHLSKTGFNEQMVSPVMVLGANGLPGQRNWVYGIVDPVFG